MPDPKPERSSEPDPDRRRSHKPFFSKTETTTKQKPRSKGFLRTAAALAIGVFVGIGGVRTVDYVRPQPVQVSQSWRHEGHEAFVEFNAISDELKSILDDFETDLKPTRQRVARLSVVVEKLRRVPRFEWDDHSRDILKTREMEVELATAIVERELQVPPKTSEPSAHDVTLLATGQAEEGDNDPTLLKQVLDLLTNTGEVLHSMCGG